MVANMNVVKTQHKFRRRLIYCLFRKTVNALNVSCFQFKYFVYLLVGLYSGQHEF